MKKETATPRIDMSRFAPRTDWARHPKDRRPETGELLDQLHQYIQAYQMYFGEKPYGGSGGEFK